jgi:hypothetical protein
MKTDKNSRTTTTEGTQPKPELTVPDNRPQGQPGKYWVHLYWIHTDEAILKITAKSLAQAEAMAYRIKPEQLPEDELYCIEGEIVINSVQPIKEGKTND